MEGRPFVLQISSDEEECLEEGDGQKNTDHDWIKEFLVSDEEQGEVVVLSVVEKPEHESKYSRSRAAMKDKDDEEDDDDDDDDCLVLDGDPENIVTTLKEATAGSDDLVVVGVKGQVACRDYPHPRHLCAKFPFSSNLHERHCEQCYCYVCDSLAPCLKWGTGLSTTDHCHATDKSKMWKTLREVFKLGKTAPIPVSTSVGTPCNVGNPLHNHNHNLLVDILQFSPNSILLNPFSPAARTRSPVNFKPQNQPSQANAVHASASLNSSLQNQVSMSATIPVCSPANITTPHIANHGLCNDSASSFARNRYQSHPLQRQLLGVRNHAIQKERAVSLGHQFLHLMMPNGVGSAGSPLPINHPSHGSFGLNNHVISAQPCNRYQPATGFSWNGTIYQQGDVRVPNIVLHPQPSSGQATLNSVNKNISQAYCQSDDSQNFNGYWIQDSHAPSSSVAHLNRNQHLNVNQVGTVHGIIKQDACQQKPHNESQIKSALQEDFSAFDSSSAENASQPQNISHLQCSRFINQPPNIKESGTQFTGSTNLGMVDDIKKFLFGEVGSVPVVENGALASELNIESPYLSPIDTDMFFI